MKFRLKQFRRAAHPSGFSLIDVLVAIIVLATALLALAALQGTLTRNTADARARSQIASLSAGFLDQARTGGYLSITNKTVTPNSGSSATPDQLMAYNVQRAAGVSNLSVNVASETWVADSTGAFAVATGAVDSAAPQFKKVTVTSTWTDASGQARQFKIDTVINPLAIQHDSTLVDRDSGAGSGVSSPTVRENNPAGAGVIPIAISGDTDTAATNPRPDIVSKGNKSAVVATRYDVLTYQNDTTDGSAKIQKRVETSVIQCRCKYGNPTTLIDPGVTNSVFRQAFRPTFWNGVQYAQPDQTAAGYSAPAGPEPNLTDSQSPYCTDCCRDHHDGATDKVKFDPFRTDHKHYKTDSSGKLVVDSSGNPVEASATSGDTYAESCRLIRVNGLYRTSVDMNSEHLGLLATANNATSTVPDSTYTGKYEQFVKDYLSNRFVDGATPNPNSLYASEGLTDPVLINIAYSAVTPDFRYLHARGLYIDHIEPDAAKALSDALANCQLTNKVECVLPYIPFTAINVTELANWTKTDSTVIDVTTASGTNFGDPLAPIRGRVNAVSTATTGQTSNAAAAMTKSNSGVAIGFPIDPDDATVLAQSPVNNSQPFAISLGGSGSGNKLFSVIVAGLPQTSDTNTTNDPLISWGHSCSFNSSTGTVVCTGKGDCAATLDPLAKPKADQDPNPYACTADTNIASNSDMDVIAGGYNRESVSSGKDPCTSKGGSDVHYCWNYAVSQVVVDNKTITPSMAVYDDGQVVAVPTKPAEGTIVHLTSILNPNSTVTLTYSGTSQQAQYSCPNGTKQPANWVPCR